MPAIKQPPKVQCINPNTGRRINIEVRIYDLFSAAIYHVLKRGNPLTFTQLAAGVKERFSQQETVFDGAVEWYTVAIKNDLQSKGVIETFMQKGKKLHRLKQ